MARTSRLEPMSASPSSTAAEVSAISEAVERSSRRLAELVEPYLGTEREDIIAVLYEAERQLLSANRTLQRALRTLGE